MADGRGRGEPLLSTYRAMVLGAALGWTLVGVGAFLKDHPGRGVIWLTIGLAIAYAHLTGR